MLADSMRWAFSDEETLFLKGYRLADVIKKNENSCPLFLDIDLRGINLSPIQEGDLLGLIDRARNVFVITSNQIYRFSGLKRIDFLHVTNGDKRLTQVWFDGEFQDEIWWRVAQMMDENSTAVRDIVDVMGYTRGVNVHTTPIKSQSDISNIRVPDGERVYLHDVQIKEDGSASGYIVHADKDFSIPSSTVGMFKAIGELNAQ